MSITTAQAVSLLENVLFESAAAAQAHAAQWVSISQNDTASTVVSDIATAMAGTAEAGIAAQVVRYYEGALGREPTVQEVAYYVKVAEAGLSSDQIAQGASAVSQSTWNQIATYFAASTEFHTLYGGSDSAVVSALYQNILGRAPSAAESAYYQKVLEGGTSVSTVVQYFVTSPEFQDKSDAKIETKLAATGVDAVNGTTPHVTASGTPSVGSGVSLVDLNNLGAGAGAVTITSTGSTGSALTAVDVVNGGSSWALMNPYGTGAALTTDIHVTGTAGQQLTYTSGGTVHTVDLIPGLSVDVPAGATGVHVTGVTVTLATPTHI